MSCLALPSDDNTLTSALQTEDFKLHVTTCRSVEELVSSAGRGDGDMVVIGASGQTGEWIAKTTSQVRTVNKQIFMCVYTHSMDVGREAALRLDLAKAGGFLTSSVESVKTAAERVQLSVEQRTGEDLCSCPFCKKAGLTAVGLFEHCSLCHMSAAKIILICPICKQRPMTHFLSHLERRHTPGSNGDDVTASLDIVTSARAVVQRDDKRILLSYKSGYSVPGGKLNPGEDLRTAARREVLEETGVLVELLSVLNMEFNPCRNGDTTARLKCTFLARPADPDQDVKTLSDAESGGAAWVSKEDLEGGLPVRDNKPLAWLKHLEEGRTGYPLSILDSP